MTKQQFIKLLNHYGFVFDESNEYYRLDGKGKNNGRLGVKVGQFMHSCHVDSTDILVLLLIDEDGKTETTDEIELWLHKL